MYRGRGGRDTGGYPNRGGRSSRFSDNNSHRTFQKDDADGSFSDNSFSKRGGRGRGRIKNMHQNSPANYRNVQGFEWKQKSVACNNSENTPKDQNVLNFNDCEPESFGSNKADPQTQVCLSSPELASSCSPSQSGATSTAVSQSRINPERAGSSLQSGCTSQSSQAKGDLGNVGHLPVSEPFDICCQSKTGGSVMLNPPLLDVNRRKRNESMLAPQGEEQILRPGMVLLKKFLTTNDQVKIVKRCRDLGLGHGGFYQPGYSDGAKLRLKMMCLGKNWDPDTSEYGDERPADGSKPPSIPPEFHHLVEKALKHSCALVEKGSKTGRKGDIPWMTPDLCIVNFYSASGRLGLHQDKDESKESLEKGLPVVSFSIGDTGEFLYSDKRDENTAEKVLLESGDVLIFGGKSRHIFHGVSVIQKNTAPKPLLDETNLKPGRLNLTFRKY